MACEICGSNACTRSFHSLAEQDEHDSGRAELKARIDALEDRCAELQAALVASLKAIHEQWRLIDAIQDVIRSYLPGDGITQDQAIAEIIELTDGPNQRAMDTLVKDAKRLACRVLNETEVGKWCP